MPNTLRHLREVSVKCVGCVKWVDNAKYTETLKRSVSEVCRLCRVGRQC